MIAPTLRKYLSEDGLIYALLGVILLTGAYLRWLPIDGVSLASIISGDAKEYRLLAEFFLDQSSQLPPDRYPGYPLLLAGLFAILPFDHDSIQIASSVGLGVLVVALTYILAVNLLDREMGVVVAALVALQPQMVLNAHRGMSDELYLSCLLILLILFLRTRSSSAKGSRVYLLLGLSCASVALVRPDGAHIFIPIFLTFLWQNRSQGYTSLLATLPIVALPIILPRLIGAWTDAHGIQDMDMRLGRIVLWMEFMLGRMPYSYTFYKETHVSEWLLGYHDLSQLIALGVKSSIRNFLALGQQIWGQIPLLLALAGIIRYVRDEREWVLPLAIPLAVLPQWGIVALWAEADVERYSIRTVPLLLVFLAMGSCQLSAWVGLRYPMRAAISRRISIGIVLLSLTPALIPLSLYASIRPTVEILMTERLEYLPRSSEVHPELVATWDDVAAGRIALPAAVELVARLRNRHPAYAPTHFALGVFYMSQGKRGEAIASLEKAVEIVPFFVEAAALLTELYIIEERYNEASSLMEQTVLLRKDYPLVELLRGHLHAMAGEHLLARQAYSGYLRLNRYQHERAFVRALRITHRNGADTSGLAQARAALKEDEAGLTSAFLWNYLSLDLDGIVLSPPQDQNIYYNLGVADLLDGDKPSALRNWTSMARLSPADAKTWGNLGTLQAVQGATTQAKESWRRALLADPQHAMAARGLRRLDSGTDSAAEDSYASFEIVLPLTGARLQ